MNISSEVFSPLLQKYDIINFHSLSTGTLAFVNIINPHTQVILSFWGSDLYQIWGSEIKKKSNSNNYYEELETMKRADLITVHNYQMERAVIAKYGPEMQNKIVRALIGIRDDIFESIDKAKKNNPDPAFISTFNIPPNKIKITIGYCGDPICNHILILNELEKIDTDIKNKIHLLLPMTYGYFSQEYMDEVKEKLNYSMISYTIFDKYLPLEEVVQLRVISDVMIMMNMSDALSHSVCEAIYADNILISAIWLPYSPLRLEKIFFFETDFLNLSKTVIDVLDNFSEFKLKSIKNAERIKKLTAFSNTSEKWILAPSSFPADGIDVFVPVFLADQGLAGLLHRVAFLSLPASACHVQNEPSDPRLHPFTGGAFSRPQTTVKEIVSDVLQKTT